MDADVTQEAADVTQVMCPQGWRGSLPCPGCTCSIQNNEPPPLCGTDSLIPCRQCSGACPYREHRVEMQYAEAGGSWYNGDPIDDPWCPIAAPAPASQGWHDPEFDVDAWNGAPLIAPPPQLPLGARSWGDPAPTGLDPADLTHLDGLNPDQTAAATHVGGPCLVSAGAGSGKTRAVIARIAHLVRAHSVPPPLILAVTFTRKAAAEMKERVGVELGEEVVKNIRIQTYHSCCLRLLRNHAHEVGLRPRFSMWDDTAAKRRIRDILKGIVEDSDYPKGKREYSPSVVLAAINKAKEDWDPADADVDGHIVIKDEHLTDLELALRRRGEAEQEREPHQSHASRHLEPGGSRPGTYIPASVQFAEIAAARKAYEDLKRTVGAVDFSDLVYLVVRSAHVFPNFRERVSTRWQYVIVDEYQDSNLLQERFIELIGGAERNVMVVGDDDQSIYGWRGSKVELITTFQARWSARVIQLGQNYRSWDSIVGTADASIRHNENRVPKKLWSERGEGGGVFLTGVPTAGLEPYRIASAIDEWTKSGRWRPSDIAVLVRRRRTLRMVAVALRKLDIPFIAVGQKPWWQTSDVQLIMAWLRVLVNPQDLDAASHILAAWPRIGPVVLKRWKGFINPNSRQSILLGPLLRVHDTARCGPKTVTGRNIQACSDLYKRLATMLREDGPIVDIIDTVLEVAGLNEEIRVLSTQGVAETQEAEDRQSAIQPFQDAAREHGGTGARAVTALLDDIATQARKLTETGDAVTVSTIHGAKGLEWPVVVGAAIVDGVLPGEGGNVPEERRLFYVLCTRARDILVLSYHWTSFGERPQPCKPSSFIREAEAAGYINDSSWAHLITHIARAPQ